MLAWYERQSPLGSRISATATLSWLAVFNVLSLVILCAYWNVPGAKSVWRVVASGAGIGILAAGMYVAHILYAVLRKRPKTFPSRWIASIYLFGTVALFIIVSSFAMDAAG